MPCTGSHTAARAVAHPARVLCLSGLGSSMGLPQPRSPGGTEGGHAILAWQLRSIHRAGSAPERGLYQPPWQKARPAGAWSRCCLPPLRVFLPSPPILVCVGDLGPGRPLSWLSLQQVRSVKRRDQLGGTNSPSGHLQNPSFRIP